MSRDLEDCHYVLGPMRASELLMSAAALDITNVSIALLVLILQAVFRSQIYQSNFHSRCVRRR